MSPKTGCSIESVIASSIAYAEREGLDGPGTLWVPAPRKPFSHILYPNSVCVITEPAMRPYILAILMAMTVGAIVVAAYTLGAPPVASTAQQTPTAAQQTPTAAPTTAATTQTPAQARQPLVVEARVAPVRSVELTLPVSGVPIAEVLVREGDTVALGAPLVRLDTRDLQL